MGAQDHARGEEAKNDHGDEVKDVARIEHAFLNGFEMSHDAEGGDGLHEPRIGPADEQIRSPAASRRELETDKARLRE